MPMRSVPIPTLAPMPTRLFYQGIRCGQIGTIALRSYLRIIQALRVHVFESSINRSAVAEFPKSGLNTPNDRPVFY